MKSVPKLSQSCGHKADPAHPGQHVSGADRSGCARSVEAVVGVCVLLHLAQGKMSNYATDLFGPIFDEIQAITGARPYTDKVSLTQSESHTMCMPQCWRTGLPLWDVWRRAEVAGMWLGAWSGVLGGTVCTCAL